MKKLLITGFSGFVSRHFLDYLFENKLEFEILGVDVTTPNFACEKYSKILKIQYQKLNLLDKDAVDKTIMEFKPDYVLHLASFSSVSYSWKHPEECFFNNTHIFMNLTEAIRKNDLLDCRILSVGSSEEYGNVPMDLLPLREDMPLQPLNPYAVARVAQENMAKVMTEGYGMKIILTRSFNHIGPFQDERFVIPSFVKRVLDVANTGASSGVIETGDVSIIRDFLDVRDVVRAYYLLLTEGVSGQVYNVCSGKGTSLEAVLSMIADFAGLSIESKVNPDYVRPDENKVIIGSFDKLKNDLGWEPVISLEKTLQDIIDVMN